MRSHATARPILLFACLLALALGGCAGENGAPPSDPRSRAELGAEWFRSFCASCHGVDARGNGPVAEHLSVPPADLTRIAARRGGSFDAAEIAAFIDGGERVRAHGSPEMPVWGRALDDRREGGFRDETLLSPGSIYLIVAYLESIQTPSF